MDKDSLRQRGASLIIVMLILIVATILGIGGAQIALLGEKSSRNDRDYQMAWQGAEAALMDSQVDIRGAESSRGDAFAAGNVLDFAPVGCGSSGRSKGLCTPSETGKAVWLQNDLSAPDVSSVATVMGTFTGTSFPAGAVGIQPSRSPRYLIEVVLDPEVFRNKSEKKTKKYVYRVTAMGFGPRADIQAVSQMLFRKETK